MFGYMGQMVKINLSNGSIEKKQLNNNFTRKYLGGNGFAAKLIYDSVPKNVDAFSEENCVVFAVGPFNNTPVWGSGRGHIATISPLTNLFFDSNFGGAFPSLMKKTGFDAITITGKSNTPVYIKIENNDVMIKDASFLWGNDTEKTAQILYETEGREIETAIIGPAGENGVLYANVMCSGTRLSTAGRGGIGAVLGAKNCKAIVVNGSMTVDVSNRSMLKAHLKTLLPGLLEKAKPLSKMGTPALMKVNNSRGMLGTRNNKTERFDKINLISGEYILENYSQKSTACKGCPVGCGKIVAVPHGNFANQHVKMPEYETLYAMGTMLENSDIVSIFNGNTMCDQMGIDTISFGVTLSFLIECIETGIIDKNELNIDLAFGNKIPLAQLAKETAYKNGMGKYLAMGSERLSKQLGGDSFKLLHSVKGLEIAGHSARGQRHLGLAYATSTRGGSHQDARPQYLDDTVDPGFDDQQDFCISSQHNSTIGDSLIMCRFLSERAFGAHLSDELVKTIHYVTGWEIGLKELNTTAERIYNLERLINIGRGADRRQDTLPYNVTHNPIPDGPVKGRYCPQEALDKMLENYYKKRKWNKNGVPTPEKLLELDIA